MTAPTIKAIETRYNDYRFRSRLEARWAVFLDAIGVKYEYEPEGYDLDGIRYLPDFYLPALKSFVEIKPTLEPNEQEWEKAKRLARQSGRSVFIFGGSIVAPDVNQLPPRAIWFRPGALVAFRLDPHEVIIVRYSEMSASLAYAISECEGASARMLETAKQNNYRAYILLRHLFKALSTEHQAEIHELGLYRADAGLPVFFHPNEAVGMYAWQQCIACNTYEIAPIQSGDVASCPCGASASMRFSTESLNHAYTAARQARFEHGESGAPR